MLKRLLFTLVIILPTFAFSAPRQMLLAGAPQIGAKSYILMDANTGRILAEKNQHERLPPGSMAKLMTLYVVFQELVNGQIQLDDTVRVSKKAWKMEGSRMFLEVGSEVSVNDLIRGMAVVSGNDASTAIAQYISGTESAFVQIMNHEAKVLGMKGTHFTDATGLPNPELYSSAYDLALLARALIRDFPQYYHYFSEKFLTWNNIKQPNRNRLLWRNLGVDGLKTGHTKAAGYCLVASAKQDGMRLISVVMNTNSSNARINDSQALLRYGFRFFTSKKIVDAQQALGKIRVWSGEHKTIPVGLEKALYATILERNKDNIKMQIELKKNVQAPVKKGQILGKLTVSVLGETIEKTNVVALKDDPKGGLWRRFSDWVVHLFVKLSTQTNE